MKMFLFLSSLVLRFGSRVKNFLYTHKIYTPEKAPIPVISVGNISFGGSEKTPLVMHLTAFLEKKGIKPALVSRGYRGNWEKKGGILSDGKKIYGTWKDSGDEPFMAARNAPRAGVFIGRNRLFSCQKARKLGFKVVILDDGFQHRRLHRDLDIVLFDPREKLSLREPVSSLERADVILVNKKIREKNKSWIKACFPVSEVFEYSVVNRGFVELNGKTSLPPDIFKGKRALAFCGIARPERFHAVLEEAGVKVALFYKFPDHYSYPLSSLEKIAHQFRKLKPDLAVTTEKDSVKIASSVLLRNIPLYYLKIGLTIEEKFYEKIVSSLLNSTRAEK